MKKILLYTVALTLISTGLFAQSNSVEISATPKVWMNSMDVFHDDFNGNALSSNNQFGVNADVNYRSITTSGWTYGIGLGYGQYSEKLNIKYSDLGQFWENGSYANRGKDASYSSSSGYVTAQIFGGYIFNLPSSQSLDQRLGVEIGLKKMFFLTTGGGPYEETLYADMNNPNSDFATFSWGPLGYEKFAGPILAELNATYYLQPKNSNRKLFVGISVSGFPAFHYPHTTGGRYDGMSNLVEYKRDISGNKTYAEKGESTFPFYGSIGLKLGIDLWNF